jgi:predicted nucleic acid-binding protein
MIILLDAGPLGLITNPSHGTEAEACNLWMERLLGQGIQVFVPEIADYEVRHELLRANKTKGLQRLDALKQLVGFAPIKNTVVQRAAEYWARARNMGKPTADDKALDCDMFLVAQAAELGSSGESVVIATTNVRHLSLFAQASRWEQIRAH